MNDFSLEELIEILAYIMLAKFDQQEEILMALVDDVAALSAAVTSLQTAVTGAEGAVVTPAETAASQQATADITNAAAALSALVPA